MSPDLLYLRQAVALIWLGFIGLTGISLVALTLHARWKERQVIKAVAAAAVSLVMQTAELNGLLQLAHGHAAWLRRAVSDGNPDKIRFHAHRLEELTTKARLLMLDAGRPSESKQGVQP